MATKKKNKEGATAKGSNGAADLDSSAQLLDYLKRMRDDLDQDKAPAIMVLSAIGETMSRTGAEDLYDNKCKEVAREIWNRLSKSATNLEPPPLLFAGKE